MIRLVFLLRRKADLSLSEFSDRWRLDHGPIVAGNQTALGVLRYTQSHRVDDPMNEAMARAHNPFGDGRSSQRIVELIAHEIGYQA